jgi:hypothetical protein
VNEHPAVRRAKVLAHYGKSAEAEHELRQALKAEPKHTELLLALLEVLPKPSPPGGLRYQLTGWLLLFGSVALAMAPLLLSIRHIEQRFQALPENPSMVVLAACTFLAVVIASLVAGLYLFFWLWFSYLRRLPVEERNFAEGKLALSMNLYSMEPQYSRVRRRMLRDVRADA